MPDGSLGRIFVLTEVWSEDLSRHQARDEEVFRDRTSAGLAFRAVFRYEFSQSFSAEIQLPIAKFPVGHRHESILPGLEGPNHGVRGAGFHPDTSLTVPQLGPPSLPIPGNLASRTRSGSVDTSFTMLHEMPVSGTLIRRSHLLSF